MSLNDTAFARLTTQVAQRSVVLVAGPTRDPVRWASQFLRHLDVPRVLLVSVDPVTSSDSRIECIHVGGAEGSDLERIRAYCRLLFDEPSHPLASKIKHWDQATEAVVVLSSYLQRPRPQRLFNRPVLGGRLKRWIEIEDKMAQPAIWRSAGVNGTADYASVRLHQRARFHQECRRLSHRTSGVVVALSSTNGNNAAGEGTYWLTGDGGCRGGGGEMRTKLHSEALSARIMPYYEGTPCSVHGLVMANGVAVLDPMVQMIDFDEGSGRFRYRGIEPDGGQLGGSGQVLRGMALRVGEVLSRDFRYCGAFSLDAIATDDGQVVLTEINSRLSDGFWALECDDVAPLALYDLAIRTGNWPEIGAVELEDHIRQITTDRRQSRSLAPSTPRASH